MNYKSEITSNCLNTVGSVKMNEMFKVFVLIVALAAADDTKESENGKIKNCQAYDVAWRIAKCAASQSEVGLITDKVFALYLQYALRKLPVNSRYTSLGMTTGSDRELIFGQQNHYDFDGFKYSIGYDLRHGLFNKALVSMRKAYKRPVLLFVKNIPDGIPIWRENLPGFVHPKGAGTELQLYLSNSPSNFLPKETENCNSFYDWDQRESFEGAVGSAMIMDASKWCPIISNSKFDIVVADIVERVLDSEEKDSKFFETNWEITSEGNVGRNLDSDYMKVFL